MEKKELDRIGNQILYERDYEGLRTYFESVWASKHEYVVIFARRCYALNNIFLRVAFNERERKGKTKHVITQNGLLLYAERFAEKYDATGRLPSVLLSDDIILHGRGISKTLYDFEMQIQQHLMEIRKVDELTDSEQYYLHRALIDAVKISVYAINETPILLEGLTSWNIQAASEKNSKELRALSQRISLFLQKAAEPNTSYRYSFQLPAYKVGEPVDGWDLIKWQYRGEQRNVYIKKNSLAANFFPVVYTHGTMTFNNQLYTWVSGEVSGGDIPKAKIDWICEKIIAVLSEDDSKKFSFIIRALMMKSTWVYRVKMQLVSFILSVICVADFCESCGFADFDSLYKSLHQDQKKVINSDMHKLAANFGIADDSHDAIWEFVSNPALTQKVKSAIWKEFYVITEPIERTFSTGELSESVRIQYNTIVEDVFYRLGMDSECEAYEISRKRKRFRPDLPNRSPDVISLRSCLKEIATELTAQGIEPDIRYMQACLSTLLDCGLAAMNFSYNQDSEKIECTLKAGELSTFVIPRRFQWFMPALSLIEREFYGDREVPVDILKQFIDQLFLEPEAKNVGHSIDHVEQAAFMCLKKFGGEFINRIYQCGQTLNGWNANLMTLDDYKDLYSSSGVSYLKVLDLWSERQDYYLSKAREFLSATITSH